MLMQAMAALSSPLITPVPHGVKGKPNTCWQTVARIARQRGGQLVSGWSVLEIEPRLPQSHRLARIVLNAHAVLEKDGVLWETIPERYHALGFIRGETPTRNACIEFFDDRDSLNSVQLPSWDFDWRPYTRLVVELTETAPGIR
jgi:hypothetical protein